MKHKLQALVTRLKSWVGAHKKLSAVLAVLFVGVAAFGVIALAGGETQEVARTEPAVTVQEEEPEPEPVLVPSPLTGVDVSEEAAARPVTAIVIENSPDARPQSSLHQAGFVFESIAEGGITRYLAMYQENRPDPIGPVRSLRPYFSDWVLAFDASVAHVGGSAEALGEVSAIGVKSLNQFAHGPSYYRITERFAPHNVYTDFDKLDALNNSLGYTSSDFESFPRKAPQKVAVPTASTITVNISSITYQSSYTYKPSTNTYLRNVGGQPELDQESNTQIEPTVVVVIEAPYSISGDGRYHYDLVGEGKVTVFQDGDVQVGTWKKTARDAQMTFVADSGDAIKLNPGQVWMTAISPDQEVEFAP